MIGPLEILINENIYTSCLNIVYENGLKKLETDFLITKLKIYKSKLFAIGRYKLLIFDLEENIKKILKFQYFIGDIFYDGDTYIATMCSKLIKNGEIFNLNLKSIQFINFCGDFILAGGYNLLLVHNFKSNDYVIFDNLHIGRVFDAMLSEHGFISAGEDRRITIIDKRGLWTIQETRSYVIKCKIFENIIFTIDKNGVVKIYKDRKIFYEECFGKLCVDNGVLHGNILILTFSNGLVKLINLSSKNLVNECNYNKIQKYENLEIDNFFIEKLEEFIKINDNDQINHLEKNDNNSVDLDKKIVFEKVKNMKIEDKIINMKSNNMSEVVNTKPNISKNFKSNETNCEFIKIENQKGNFEDNIFKILKKYDYQNEKVNFQNIIEQNITNFPLPKNCKILKNSVIVHKKNQKIKTLEIKKPNCFFNKSVGTKNGYLIFKNYKFKICKDSILYVKRRKLKFTVFTKENLYLVKIVDFQKILKYYRPIDNKLSFRIFTCAISINSSTSLYKKEKLNLCCHKEKDFRHISKKKITNDYIDDDLKDSSNLKKNKELANCNAGDLLILAGTIENKVVLIKNEKIVDTLTVNGSVSAIAESKKSAFVTTKSGAIYKIKIIKNKLYIKYDLINDYKISDCCYYKRVLYFVDINGNIKKLEQSGKKFKLIKKFNTYLTKIKVANSEIYVTTSKGDFIKIDEKNNYVIKYKLGISAIQTMEIYNKNILLGLDSHKIICLTNEKIAIFSKCSSFAKQIKYLDFIYVLSDDYFFV